MHSSPKTLLSRRRRNNAVLERSRKPLRRKLASPCTVEAAEPAARPTYAVPIYIAGVWAVRREAHSDPDWISNYRDGLRRGLNDTGLSRSLFVLLERRTTPGETSFGTGNRGGSMIVRPKSSGLRPFESISGNQSFRIFVIRPALFNSSLATA